MLLTRCKINLMRVRFATKQDKARVLSLFTQLGLIINQKLGKNYPKNENARKYGSVNYDQVMKSKHIKIFVIEDKNKIIGVASFFVFTDMISGEKFAHIDDFIIDKPFRGCGFGKKLMNGILDYAKKYQIETVKLTSSLQFTIAHKFYKSLGGKFTQKVISFSL